MESRFIALKEGSLVRLRNVDNAKQVHLFKQTLEELGEWIKRKFNELVSVDIKSGVQLLADLRKSHDAFVVSPQQLGICL